MLGDGNEGMSTIPGFNQIQFEGFCRFIDQGLTEELYKFPKIEDTDQEIEFQLFVERYQLVEPLIKERDALVPLSRPEKCIVGTGLERQAALDSGALAIAEREGKIIYTDTEKILFSGSKQTTNPWIFKPEYPRKLRIFDGRLRNPFEQPVIIGKPYILKLIHQVDDKIHGRSSGYYALVIQKSLSKRAKQGGNE
ncbi:DNA-directed RNA polymerase subunit beta [Forsythia ovata]|uniref:DNA-directed RNA polymerase n=1 Tax=Forsythia ovata TaxID=205694 RepID=A0ABD1RKC7_9LAMI